MAYVSDSDDDTMQAKALPLSSATTDDDPDSQSAAAFLRSVAAEAKQLPRVTRAAHGAHTHTSSSLLTHALAPSPPTTSQRTLC